MKEHVIEAQARVQVLTEKLEGLEQFAEIVAMHVQHDLAKLSDGYVESESHPLLKLESQLEGLCKQLQALYAELHGVVGGIAGKDGQLQVWGASLTVSLCRDLIGPRN